MFKCANRLAQSHTILSKSEKKKCRLIKLRASGKMNRKQSPAIVANHILAYQTSPISISGSFPTYHSLILLTSPKLLGVRARLSDVLTSPDHLDLRAPSTELTSPVHLDVRAPVQQPTFCWKRLKTRSELRIHPTQRAETNHICLKYSISLRNINSKLTSKMVSTTSPPISERRHHRTHRLLTGCQLTPR